jgi:ABC-type nitrate/sulfonate/bicarbonate transport system substrate-binding protein
MPLNVGHLFQILLLAVAAGPLLSCEPRATSSRALVWGGPKNISMLPIIAEKKGFFKEEGLEVRPNYVQTGKIAMDAVVSGDLDFGIIVETNIAFVKFQEGADIKVVASIAE